MKQRLVAVSLTIVAALGLGIYVNQWVFLAAKKQSNAREEARARAMAAERKQKDLEDKKFQLSSPLGTEEYLREKNFKEKAKSQSGKDKRN